jgi:hypothetical protein
VVPNPFVPEMTHFTLPLHATREELIEIASRWALEHDLYVSVERWHPTYGAAAVPLGGDIATAVAQFHPVRRICLRKDVFDVDAISQTQHLARNPESFVMVLEPLTDDGLRATALTARMGDENVLRWWVALVRAELGNLRAGAWAIEPGLGGRQYVAEHFHTEGARALAREGVPMLAAAGSAVFELDDGG